MQLLARARSILGRSRERAQRASAERAFNRKYIPKSRLLRIPMYHIHNHTHHANQTPRGRVEPADSMPQCYGMLYVVQHAITNICDGELVTGSGCLRPNLGVPFGTVNDHTRYNLPCQSPGPDQVYNWIPCLGLCRSTVRRTLFSISLRVTKTWHVVRIFECI